MRIEPFDRIAPALAAIDAVELERFIARDSDVDKYFIFYKWSKYFIRASWNLRDDLNVSLSDRMSTLESDDCWKSIFSVTIPGFDNFSDRQKIDWALSTPSGVEGDQFVADQILALPSAMALK